MKYNKENKKHLLIQENFWKDIVNEKKLYEYRKLSKGLIGGIYFLFSTETKEYLGSVVLDPLNVNEFGKYEEHLPTINWVNENYGNKDKDYVCYNIDDVKEVK